MNNALHPTDKHILPTSQCKAMPHAEAQAISKTKPNPCMPSTCSSHIQNTVPTHHTDFIPLTGCYIQLRRPTAGRTSMWVKGSVQ